MKRVVFDVPRWSIYLHRQERHLPLVQEDDSKDVRFEDEVFERLYGGKQVKLNVPDPVDAKWAEAGHKMCDDLCLSIVAPYCRDNAFNAALATAWLMELIEEPLSAAKDKAEKEEQRSRGEAEEAAEGLEHVDMSAVGGSGTGQSEPTSGQGGGGTDLERKAEYLKKDPRLRRIALLAGRLRSSVITKQRTKKTDGPQEIVNITVGGELERLVPSELMRFAPGRSRLLRLAAMRDLVERKLIQHELQATEPVQNGPIIVCIDKSSSMEGARDEWASGVALALLEIAYRQKRAFGLISFCHEIIAKVLVPAGGKLDVRHLLIEPAGGTAISLVLKEALDLIRQQVARGTELGDADVVLITDGESNDVDRAPKLKREAEDLNVTIFGVGIDSAIIKPWCHQSHVITDVSSVDDRTSDMLFSL